MPREDRRHRITARKGRSPVLLLVDLVQRFERGRGMSRSPASTRTSTSTSPFVRAPGTEVAPTCSISAFGRAAAIRAQCSSYAARAACSMSPRAGSESIPSRPDPTRGTPSLECRLGSMGGPTRHSAPSARSSRSPSGCARAPWRRRCRGRKRRRERVSHAARLRRPGEDGRQHGPSDPPRLGPRGRGVRPSARRRSARPRATAPAARRRSRSS